MYLCIYVSIYVYFMYIYIYIYIYTCLYIYIIHRQWISTKSNFHNHVPSYTGIMICDFLCTGELLVGRSPIKTTLHLSGQSPTPPESAHWSAMVAVKPTSIVLTHKKPCQMLHITNSNSIFLRRRSPHQYNNSMNNHRIFASFTIPKLHLWKTDSQGQ